MSKKFQRYRSLIFDYDDTLVNTFKIRSRAVQECGKKYYGKKISLMLIKTFWGTPFQEFLPIIMGTRDPYEKVAPNYFEVAKRYPLSLLPGVKESLAELSPKYLLGIVSSSNRAILDFDFEKAGLEPELFFVIQTAEQTKFHKPDERVFLPLLEKLDDAGVHPKEVLYIGDSFYDQQSAMAAGFDFLGVATGLVTVKQFYKNFADVIKNMSFLPEFLANLPDD